MNRNLYSAAIAAICGVAVFAAASLANQPGTESKSPADATQKGVVQKVAPVQKDAPVQKVAPVQKTTPVQGPTQKVTEAPTQKSPVQKVACDDCGGGRHHGRRNRYR